MSEEKKTDLVSLLLRPELPNVLKELPTARYRIKRLSELTGEDVVFTLRGLPYGKVQKLRESLSDDVSVHILLQGCVEPDLSRAVEKLCGYRRTTIDEVKNA